jgi:hypothetical protein
MRQILQNKPPPRIQKPLHKRLDIMSPPTRNINQKHILIAALVTRYNLFLNWEPFNPPRPTPSIPLHKRIRDIEPLGILGDPRPDDFVDGVRVVPGARGGAFDCLE